MNHASIPLSKIQSDMYNQLLPGGGGSPVLEICRIEEVDTKNRLVSAYFLRLKKVLHGVPYCLPFYNHGTGIIFMPSKGALAIASFNGTTDPAILAFTCPTKAIGSTPTHNIPELGPDNFPEVLEGEVLVSGVGRSFIKFDKLGGFTLSSAVFAYVSITADGDYIVNVENAILTVNGTMTEEYLVDYEKKMTITKGIHASQQRDNRLELCYEIMLGDKLVFGITTDGRIITDEEEKHERRIRSRQRARTNIKSAARRYGRTP